MHMWLVFKSPDFQNYFISWYFPTCDRDKLNLLRHLCSVCLVQLEVSWTWNFFCPFSIAAIRKTLLHTKIRIVGKITKVLPCSLIAQLKNIEVSFCCPIRLHRLAVIVRSWSDLMRQPNCLVYCALPYLPFLISWADSWSGSSDLASKMSEASSDEAEYWQCVNPACSAGKAIPLFLGHTFYLCPFCGTSQSQDTQNQKATDMM